MAVENAMPAMKIPAMPKIIIQPANMGKTVLGVFAIMKVVKLGLSYAAITIASNYASQIYTEKVYVRNENPPKLINMLLLFLGIELALTVVVMSLIGLIVKFITSKPGEEQASTFDMAGLVMEFAKDYVLYIISMLVTGSIIGNIMYSKKYFLYKEDGLRAVRAYTDVLTQLSMFNGILPFNMFVTGVIEVATKI